MVLYSENQSVTATGIIGSRFPIILRATFKNILFSEHYYTVFVKLSMVVLLDAITNKYGIIGTKLISYY